MIPSHLDFRRDVVELTRRLEGGSYTAAGLARFRALASRPVQVSGGVVFRRVGRLRPLEPSSAIRSHAAFERCFVSSGLG